MCCYSDEWNGERDKKWGDIVEREKDTIGTVANDDYHIAVYLLVVLGTYMYQIMQCCIN